MSEKSEEILYVNVRDVTLPHIDGINIREFRRDVAENIMNCIAYTRAHSGIKTEYMAKSLCSSALLLVIRNASTKNIEGVATANVLRDKPLSLVTICSVVKGAGVGSRMLGILINIARVLGLPGVQVKPISSAVSFYLKNGFEHRGALMVLDNIGV
jgi:hypothetical protein